jgi:TatD DNase family protein
MTETRYFDAAANLTDEMYSGIYNGKKYHESDLDQVLRRAAAENVSEILVTAGSLEQSRTAIELVRSTRRRQRLEPEKCWPTLYATIGVHPTRCHEFFSQDGVVNLAVDSRAEAHLQSLRDLLSASAIEVDEHSDDNGPFVVAIGECGLDYARTQFCEPAAQRKGLELQLRLAAECGLPLLLHNRESTADLVDALKRHRHRLHRGGLVHSFDGSEEDALSLLDLGFYIGLNGCSLKTEENLRVVRDCIPLDRLVLETDCPYCEIRPSHASHQFMRSQGEDISRRGWLDGKRNDKKKHHPGYGIRGRNEPCGIVQICAVISRLKRLPMEQVSTAARLNAKRLFLTSETRRVEERAPY